MTSDSSAYSVFAKNFTKQVKGDTEKGLTLPGVVMCLVACPNASHGCCKRRGFLCMIFSGYTGMYLGGTSKMREIQEEGKGNGVLMSPQETSSLPDERGLRQHSRLQGHPGPASDMGAGLLANGEKISGCPNRPHSPGAGVIPWEKGICNRMVAFPTRPGSVVVDHSIIISLLVTTQTQEKLHNITMDLQEEILTAATQQNRTNGSCEPPSRGMGRSWAAHGVGDSFPPTQNLMATPGSGWWGMSPVLPLLKMNCASTPPTWWSTMVRSTSTKRVSRWGCPTWGDAARFGGWPASPPTDLASLSSLLPARRA